MTDPSVWGSTARLQLDAGATPVAATWSLLDHDANVVVGPVAFPYLASLMYFTVDPENRGVEVAAGSYTVEVSVTLGATTTTSALPLVIVADPGPVPKAPIAPSTRALYDDPASGAVWVVPQLSRRAAEATLHVTGPQGYERDFTFRPTCPREPGTGSCDPASEPDAAYRLRWNQRGVPGTYHASVVEPDSWGRPVHVDLGTIRQYELAGLNGQRKTWRPATVWKRSTSHIGSCASIRRAQPTGSLTLVSRRDCSGGSSTAIARFEMTLPARHTVDLNGLAVSTIASNLRAAHRSTVYDLRYRIAGVFGWTVWRRSLAAGSADTPRWTQSTAKGCCYHADLASRQLVVQIRVRGGGPHVLLRRIEVGYDATHWTLQ